MGSGSGSGLGFGVVIHAIHIIIMISMVSIELSPQVERWHFLAMTCLAVSAEPWKTFLLTDRRGFPVVMTVSHSWEKAFHSPGVISCPFLMRQNLSRSIVCMTYPVTGMTTTSFFILPLRLTDRS
jgi:hypothetical protein